MIPNAELSQMDEASSGQQESAEGSSRVASVAQAAGERALQMLEKPAPNSSSACIAVALASLHSLHAMVRLPLRRDARHVLEVPHADPAAKRALSRVLAYDQNLEAVLLNVELASIGAYSKSRTRVIHNCCMLCNVL